MQDRLGHARGDSLREKSERRLACQPELGASEKSAYALVAFGALQRISLREKSELSFLRDR